MAKKRRKKKARHLGLWVLAGVLAVGAALALSVLLWRFTRPAEFRPTVYATPVRALTPAVAEELADSERAEMERILRGAPAKAAGVPARPR